MEFPLFCMSYFSHSQTLTFLHEILKICLWEVFIIKKTDKTKDIYISDIIDVDDFVTGEFNLIASSCGSGKTYFVKNDLLDYYKTIKPRQVILVTSRAMIVDQQTKDGKADKFDTRNDNVIDYWNGLDEDYSRLQAIGMNVMTYDKLINILLNKNNEKSETLKNIKMVIFDECHTLFSDLFIKDINILKVWIRDTLYRHEKIILGLTATPNIILAHKEWGVKINQLNKEPIMRYKAEQLWCTNFETISYLITTNKLQGKTMIMCNSISDCIKLQDEIPNAAILVSRSNKYYKNDKYMYEIRNKIIEEEVLPETFMYPTKRDKNGYPIEYEERRLEVLISTSTLREGVNLKEESGIRNIVCCYTDELHITQFMGRCRFDIDNLVVADTYIRIDNYNKDDYLSLCRSRFKEFMANKSNVKWFDSISHLVRHNVLQVKRFRLCTDEKRFIDYINNKWLVPIGTDNKDLDIYKIWREEDKNGIIDMAIRCKLYELCPSKITFMRVIRTMTQSLGYEVETGNEKFDNKRLTYKLVVSFDEDKINFNSPYKNIDGMEI